MSDEQKNQLAHNIANGLKQATESVQQRMGSPTLCVVKPSM